MPKPMPKFENYPEDTITSADKVLFFKNSATAVKSITFANLVTAIRTALSSFFTSATVVPSTIPLSGDIMIGNGAAYAKAQVSGDAGLAASGQLTISGDAVTYAKMQNVSAASRLLGRGQAAGSGDPQEISLGTGLSMTGTTLNVSSGTGNVIQSTPATEANHVFVSGGADNSRVETPVEIDPSTGDVDGIGDLDVETLTTPETRLIGTHTTDNTLHGETLSGYNAGATIGQWEAVYMGGASKWLVADADGAGTYPARGLASEAYVDTDPAIILTKGTVRNDAWTWTPGGTIYLSATAGGLTQTPPAVSGDKVQAVGYALTADVAAFDFNSTYLTVA